MTDDSWTQLGLISDTHGWLNPKLLPVFETCDIILHAGDIGRPQVIEKLEEIAPVSAVRGNIDGGKLHFLPLEQTLDIEGFRVGILHIAGNPFRPNPTALAYIARDNLDILVAGHTHIPVVGKVGKALWINPGAAGREGHHNECFAARMYLKRGEEVKLERVCLGSRSSMPRPSDDKS